MRPVFIYVTDTHNSNHLLQVAHITGIKSSNKPDVCFIFMTTAQETSENCNYVRVGMSLEDVHQLIKSAYTKENR